jgi:hypothetical protein
MATALRKTGISFVGDMPWGLHFCYFYETRRDLLDALAAYFAAGLENQEFCLWVLDETVTQGEACAALRRAAPSLDADLADHSIEIVGQRAWWFRENRFDYHQVISSSLEKLDQALAADYAGMRLAWSTAWLQKLDRTLFHRYEIELSASIANERMLILCCFPLAAAVESDVLDAARAHQLAIAKRQKTWEDIEIPELAQAWNKIKQLNERLNIP